MSKSKLVKRYANRKLYDTDRSCYVTLEDIAVMIREGDEVHVIDNKSGQDLTTVTLAQIIFEAEKKKNFMPMELLRTLIKDSSSEVKSLLNQPLSIAADFAESATQAIGNTAADAKSTIEHKAPSLSDWVSRSKATIEALQKSVLEQLGSASNDDGNISGVSEAMTEIKRRIAELEESLARRLR